MVYIYVSDLNSLTSSKEDPEEKKGGGGGWRAARTCQLVKPISTNETKHADFVDQSGADQQ